MAINRSQNPPLQPWQHDNGIRDPQTARECGLVRGEWTTNANQTRIGYLAPHLSQSLEQHIDAFSRYGCSHMQEVVRPAAAQNLRCFSICHRVGFRRATWVYAVADDRYAPGINQAVRDNLVFRRNTWTGDARGLLQPGEDAPCHCAKGEGSFFLNRCQHAAEGVQIV